MELNLSRDEVKRLVNMIYYSAQLEDKIYARHLRNKLSIINYLRMALEIRGIVPQQSTLLDWGCGYGQMSYLLTQLGIKVTPFEVGARERTFSHHQLCVDMITTLDEAHLPFPNESFDAVLSCGVFEHVHDKITSLSEIQRVIKRGGHFFIYMLPNVFSINENLNSLFNRSDHNCKYTVYSIKKMLKGTQFIVTVIKRDNFLPKHFIEWFLGDPCNKYEQWLLLEKAFLRIPLVNLFSGTIEITARKQ